MRFVWAVAAFIVAAVMIGAGIAQRTVFQGPPTQSAQLLAADGTAAYTVIDGDVLTLHPGAQTLAVQGDGAVFAAYGRSADVRAWVADVPYTEIGVDDAGAITSTLVQPASGTAPIATRQAPSGSDLWLGEYSGTGRISVPLQVPASMSAVVAADGTAPAPAAITLTWPADTSTPWAGLLFVSGGLFLIGGVVLYLLGIRHARRSRGPRRKGPPPLPKTEPIAIAGPVAGEDKGVIAATPSRRSLSSRRSLIAAPLMLVAAAVALTGCSADLWPRLASSPTASPTASVIDAGNQQAPAVSEAQAGQILTRIAQTVATADSSRNADLAATRLSGAMLAERQTNYTLRGAVADSPAPAAIPATPLSVVLPQAYDGWPRTVLLVVGAADSTNPPPTIMMMTQADPWSNYKLDYSANIEAGTKLPEVAPAYVGAKAVPPDSTFLLIPPAQLAGAYADVINNGANSRYAGLFDDQSDQLRPLIDADRKKRLDQFNATGASTGNLSFSAAAGDQKPRALATLESGAIVAVQLYEIDTVKPTSADAVIKLDNNPTVKALAGTDQSQKGFTTTYGDQLFFYVPGQGSNEKIRLLGFDSHVLGAKVIP